MTTQISSNNILRQLKDVQHQAGKLLNSNPSMERIEDFGDYCEEMRAFILEHVDEDLIQQKALEIPRVTDELDVESISRGILITLIFYISSGVSHYFHERRRLDRALENVRDIQGKFASIEFLMRNYLEE